MEVLMSPYVMPGVLDTGTNKIMITEILNSCYSIIESETGVTKKNIKSNVRKRPFVDARNIIANILRKYTRMKTIDVGFELNVDHSSVCHYTKGFDHLYKHEKHYKYVYDRIVSDISL